jgi:hypothetical protein
MDVHLNTRYKKINVDCLGEYRYGADAMNDIQIDKNVPIPRC